MLPEGTEVMRRLACADVCPAQESPRATSPAPFRLPTADGDRSNPKENKELLRQQLLSAVSKDPSPAPAEPATVPKAKLTRNRQKNRWKLKFHHQALPPEYLDHYEQSLQKGNQPRNTQEKSQPSRTSQEKPVKIEPVYDVNNITNESFKLWAERLSSLQRERNAQPVQTPLLNSPILGSMISMASNKNPPKSETDKRRKQHTPAIAPSKIVTYDDLPYMGEMTLNNSKPRRGRKPKKADICHLIYENYGTIVPGQPIPSPDEKMSQLSMCDSFRRHMKSDVESIAIPQTSTSKTDLQNKIISSLLERKLTQEKKREASSRLYKSLEAETSATVRGEDGPMNLCIRDLTDLKIQIQKKFTNVYASLPEVKTEVDIDSPEDSTLTSNTISVIQRNTNLTSSSTESSPDLTRYVGNISPTLSEPVLAPQPFDVDGKLPPGYVYWPNAGLYLHPLALQTQLMYYQKLAAAGQLPKGLEESMERNISSTPNSTASESVSTELSTPPADDSKSKLVLKQISELLDPKVIKQAKKSPENAKLKRASPNPPAQSPMKRKRSAIFIPPMPAKSNSSTPTTEVSICKFKFTGGSKPSLQEKKMLSVDSGGNFRYYSGTGNKANRGYEYFQRDPSSTPEIAESSSSQAKSNMSVFDAKVFANYKSTSREASQGGSGAAASAAPAPADSESSKKKRKSRKSLQREKLEQTFKEKGFLIQTQQLQSAEGATYCKFRQLRKFTRYLFRSWKDYLPGNLDGERSQQGEPLVNTEAVPCEEEWS